MSGTHQRRSLARIAESAITIWALLGGVVLVAVVLMNTYSVIGNNFGAPFPGDFEMTEMGVCVAAFAFLPFLQPRTLVLFVLPWMLNMTAGVDVQRTLSMYYGLPLFAFLAVACVEVLRRSMRVRAASGVLACVVAVLVIQFNVAHFRFPRIPLDRWAFLQRLEQIPLEASVQASSCFRPVLGYERTDSGILSPGQMWEADFVLIRRSGSWPFTAAQHGALLARIPHEPYVTEYASGDFLILRRVTAEPAADGSATEEGSGERR